MPRNPGPPLLRETRSYSKQWTQINGESDLPGVEFREVTESVPPLGVASSVAGFDLSLQDFCLFKNSMIERLTANLIYPLSRLFSYKTRPLISRVVDRLTLWEKYLAHRSRADRRMTFSVSFQRAHIRASTYLINAISGLYRLLLSEQHAWHHQPLNVIVGEDPRSRILDPRQFISQNLNVGIVSADRAIKVVSLDMCRQPDSVEETRRYVANQIGRATTTMEEISVIFDEEPRCFDEVSGAYAEYPGAWLRIAPDRETGGLISSADHLVMDGSLHQLILLRTATASLEDGRVEKNHRPPSAHEHLISFEIPNCGSNCELMLKIGDALDEQGVRIRTGHETTLLTTIPSAGPEFVSQIPRNRARILPVLFQMRKTNTASEVRDQITKLNSKGMSNPLAFAIDRIYCGTTHPIMIRYFERFSMRIPFQKAARFLAGSSLISFIPPLEDLPKFDVKHRYEIERLNATTLRSEHGMPAILIQQLPAELNSLARMFVSFSGSGDWDCPKRLTLLANSLRSRLGLAPIL